MISHDESRKAGGALRDRFPDGSRRAGAAVARLLLPFTLLFVAGPARGAAQPVLRVGSELDFRPYAFTDEKGQATGLCVDLIKAVAEKMALQIQITTGPWDEVWGGLFSGRFDVLPTVARTPGREPLVDFTVPHTETYDAFFRRAGEAEWSTLADAAGKEVAVLRSDAAEHQLEERKFDGKIVLVGSIAEGLQLIASGKHDAFLCSKVIGVLERENAGIEGVKAGPPIPEYKREFCFAVREDNAELLEKLNQGLLIVKTSGEYKEIYERWIRLDNEPWQVFGRYVWPALSLAGILGAAALSLVLILDHLVRERTRDLNRANAEIRSEVDERRKAEISLQELNASLEQRISGRTAELRRIAAELEAANQTLRASQQAAVTAAAEADAARHAAERAGEAVRQSEQKFAALFHHSPNFKFLLHPETGAFTQVNEAWCRLTGYTRAELIGKSPIELSIVAADSAAQLLRAVRDGGRVEDLEMKFRSKTGEPRTVLLYLERLSTGPDASLVGSGTDITERKLAELASLQAQERLEEALQVSRSYAFDWDSVTDRVQRSAGCAAALGLDGDKVTSEASQAFFARLHPEDRAEVVTTLERLSPGTDRYTARYRVVRPDGAVIVLDERGRGFFDASGKLARVVGIVMDVTDRAQAEEELRRTQQRLQSTIDSITDGLMVFDKEWRITFCSGQAAQILGVRREDLLERVLWDVYPQARQLKFWNFFHLAVATRQAQRFEEFYPDPLNLWLECHCYPSEAGLTLYFHDVTEHRRAQDDLAQTKSLLEMLLSQAPIGFCFLDNDLRYLRVNPWLARMNGHPVEAHIGRTVRELFPNLADAVDQIVAEIRNTGKALNNRELRGETAASPGVIRYWNENWYPVTGTAGEIVGFGVFVEEVTERRLAEQALRQSEEKFRLAFAKAAIGFSMTAPDGRFVDVNPAYEGLLGCSLDELRTMTCADLVHPDDRAAFAALLGRALAGELSHFVAELRYLRKDGSVIDVRKSASVVRNSQGQPQWVIALVEDITERKRAEEALRERERRLRVFFDSDMVGTFYWNMDGRITEANDRFLAMIGFTREEFARGAISWSEMTPEEYRERDAEALAQLHATGVDKPYAKEFYRKDGSRVPVFIGAAMLDERRCEGIAFVLDITEQKQVEDALRESEGRLRLAKGAAQLGIYDYDVRSGTVRWDERVRQLWGAPADKRVSFDVFLSGIHPEDREGVRSAISHALEPGGDHRLSVLHRLVHPRTEGGESWMEGSGLAYFENGVPVRLVGTVLDITVHKQAETALRWNARRNEVLSRTAARLLESADPQRLVEELCREVMDLLDCQAFFNFLVDDRRPETLHLNAHAGISETDARAIEQLNFGVAVCGCVARDVRRMIAEDIGNSSDPRVELIRAYGLQAYCCHPLMMNEELIGTLSFGTRTRTRFTPEEVEVMRAVSDLVSVAMHRIRMEEALKASLQEKEVLLKEIHHRVKNNMQVISSLASLQAGEIEDAQIQTALQEMSHRVRSMAMVHERLYESPDLARIDFATYTRGLLDYLWRAHRAPGKEIALVLDLEPMQLPVDLAVPCGLVLNELAGNALKHAFTGRPRGTVRVALRIGPAGQVRLSVGDDGVGLPPGLDWQNSKTLGLRLVQMLARQLGGQVRLESGQGAEFVLAFALPADTHSPTAEPVAAAV